MRASTTKRGKRPSKSATQSARKSATASLDDEVQAVLAWLKRHGTRATREGMARYGIPSDKAFGVPVGVMSKDTRNPWARITSWRLRSGKPAGTRRG